MSGETAGIPGVGVWQRVSVQEAGYAHSEPPGRSTQVPPFRHVSADDRMSGGASHSFTSASQEAPVKAGAHKH